MNKKCLIVVANYYENISNNLLQSALRSIKKLSFKIIYFLVYLKFQLQSLKIWENMMDLLP